MRTRHPFYPSLPIRRFSAAAQSWFPAIHKKTFPGTTSVGIIQSAVRRTVART